MLTRRTLLLGAAGILSVYGSLLPAAGMTPKPRLCVWASERHKWSEGAPQRGDVVDIIDTHRHPGLAVLGNPDWRIIDVDMERDEPLGLMWLIAEDDVPKGFRRRFRRASLDLDALERLAPRRLAATDVLVVRPEAVRAVARAHLAIPGTNRTVLV